MLYNIYKKEYNMAKAGMNNNNVNLSSTFAQPIKNSKTGSSYISFSESYINKLLSNSSLKSK